MSLESRELLHLFCSWKKQYLVYVPELYLNSKAQTVFYYLKHSLGLRKKAFHHSQQHAFLQQNNSTQNYMLQKPDYPFFKTFERGSVHPFSKNRGFLTSSFPKIRKQGYQLPRYFYYPMDNRKKAVVRRAELENFLERFCQSDGSLVFT